MMMVADILRAVVGSVDVPVTLKMTYTEDEALVYREDSLTI